MPRDDDQPPGMDAAIEKAVRGPRAPRTKTVYRRTKDLIKTYGEQDTAQRLGVTIKTLRKWVNPRRTRRGSPSATNQAKIRDQHADPAVRRATAPRQRMARLAKKGMRVGFTGTMRYNIAGSSGERSRRSIDQTLPPEAAADIMGAYLDGGPEAAREAFERAMSEHYGPDHNAGWQLNFDDPSRLTFSDGDPDLW